MNLDVFGCVWIGLTAGVRWIRLKLGGYGYRIWLSSDKFGWVWLGFGGFHCWLIWLHLAGLGWAGFGWVWPSLAGFGRVWMGLAAEFGLIWLCLDAFGWIWQLDSGGFG